MQEIAAGGGRKRLGKLTLSQALHVYVAGGISIQVLIKFSLY